MVINTVPENSSMGYDLWAIDHKLEMTDHHMHDADGTVVIDELETPKTLRTKRENAGSTVRHLIPVLYVLVQHCAKTKLMYCRQDEHHQVTVHHSA